MNLKFSTYFRRQTVYVIAQNHFIYIFWQEVTDADEFRLQNLSGYSRKLHKPFDEYLKEKELFIDDKNIEGNENESSEEDDLLDFINSL